MVLKRYFMFKAAWVSLSYLIVTLMLGIYFGRFFNLPKLFSLLIITSWILPFFLKEKILNAFSRRVVFTLAEKGIVIDEYALQRNTLIRKISFNWSDILYYNIQIMPKNGFVQFNIYISRKSYTFFFRGKKCTNKNEEFPEVIKYFLNNVKAYHLENPTMTKVKYKKNFLTKKTGKYLLMFLLIISLSMSFILVFKNLHQSIFSITSLFIILGLYNKRKKEIALESIIENY